MKSVLENRPRYTAGSCQGLTMYVLLKSLCQILPQGGVVGEGLWEVSGPESGAPESRVSAFIREAGESCLVPSVTWAQ